MTDALTRAAIEAHREWLGFVQPIGLVVAEPVLVERGVILDRHARPRQERFKELLDGDEQRLTDIRALFTDFLGWEAGDLAEPADALRVRLPELSVTLEPSFAVADSDSNTQLLIRVEPDGTDLDAPVPERIDGWTAPQQARFERLLRQTEIPTGLLCTPQAVRLVYAPKGETSGHVTFRVADMATVMGRPILTALDLLLGAHRLFRAPARERLPALLEASREAQNTVSTKLARQVLGSLYELLRGFVAADARDPDHRLQALARERPDEFYGGLVTALMRLVFVLYAEDRDLMPQDPVYEQHYGLRGLFAKLREDAAQHGDLMDRRYGAWARLLALFRLIHKGGGHEGLRFVARKGRLFDPDAWPFLEGRGAPEDLPGLLPMVPDGTVWRVLERLLVLDGERLSYRTLDVEQIGSVYEVVMGFRIELARGRSLALRTKAKHGAAVVVDLDALLETAPEKRARALADLEVAKLTDREAQAAKAGSSVQELTDALERKVDQDATPGLVPAGVPVLQPTDERRRSGSHYTPRSLTQPIVAETLRPILERLGPQATPEQILDLKVLDPAMGSGAFLVEACRQLAEALVKALEVHGIRPDLPPDEHALLYAKRQIAQRCLYGVDKNAMAAELGKLSLWLATLARDHEFTFLDHCIRHGDSLVGLSRRQIAAVDWAASPGTPGTFTDYLVRGAIERAERERERIREHLDFATEEDLRPLLERADGHLDDVRLIGDATVAAFFKGSKPAERKRARTQVAEIAEKGERGWQEVLRPIAAELGWGEHSIRPFHYEIELPEVFDRDNPGFDAIVGNPPFLGGRRMKQVLSEEFQCWLDETHHGSRNADLVAHFYRRAFDLLRKGGCFGLLATNTIRQGDTRATGLRPIRKAGGTIYSAVRRRKWPGESAAVVICVLNVAKGHLPGPYQLDGREVPIITAFLFHAGGDDDPEVLQANVSKSFQGSIVLGKGFTFDDTDNNGGANPIALMRELIAEDPRNAERILPFIGGEEVNDSPRHEHHRYVIDFEDMSEEQARRWANLFGILEDRVLPERAKQSRKHLRERWWQHAEVRPALRRAIAPLERVLVISQTTKHLVYAFVPSKMIFSYKIVVFSNQEWAFFSVVQSSVHEVWSVFFWIELGGQICVHADGLLRDLPLSP
jgi:N-6 DNA Methylase